MSGSEKWLMGVLLSMNIPMLLLHALVYVFLLAHPNGFVLCRSKKKPHEIPSDMQGVVRLSESFSVKGKGNLYDLKDCPTRQSPHG
ncbi:hypothetical protein Y032_0149g2694 [Ancylostoma ceylanicum]|uniref:Uncharacterized protein n=1 Tax=Ancylostoma ceylanicum TaxID=53326 RepID=A0A016T0T1_9BILA|nr:hypothetical protein Y032_0149g2694 [Ancylostoma ceylanicum]